MAERIFKGVAGLDLAVTLPFALPFIADLLIVGIYLLDGLAGFGTPALYFEAGPFGMMFVHIMGVLGVVWALARLRAPSAELARMDAVARLVVAALIVYAIVLGATPVLWLFVLTEIGGSALQFHALRKLPQ
ncbi:hypothetical protein [Parvibaculum sp.]|uniref:hypothetical protein n=1 Tax=Parvibaculum sp. TaxID=2024848 RepID=UPI00391A3320